MLIDLNAYSSEENYQTLIQLIVPRPIAWILSLNEDQKSYNLAPFSFFNIAALNPCIFSVSMGLKDNNEKKDSLRNLESGRSCTVHVCQEEDASFVSASALSFDYGVSEVDKLNLPLVEQDHPTSFTRLKRSKAAFQCHHFKSLSLGKEGQTLVLLEVKKLWVDELLLENQKTYPFEIDLKKLSPLGRLGGNKYLRQGEAFSAKRL